MPCLRSVIEHWLVPHSLLRSFSFRLASLVLSGQALQVRNVNAEHDLDERCIKG
jgi:hypothetical protein